MVRGSPQTLRAYKPYDRGYELKISCMICKNADHAITGFASFQKLKKCSNSLNVPLE